MMVLNCQPSADKMYFDQVVLVQCLSKFHRPLAMESLMRRLIFQKQLEAILCPSIKIK